MRRWLTLLLAVAQVVVPYLPFVGVGTRIGSGFTSPVVPAPYAFTIWLPIFALALGYAVWQLRSDDLIVDGLGWWPAAAFGLCTLWSAITISGPDAVGSQVGIFSSLLVVLAFTSGILSDWHAPLSANARRLAVPGFGLFAGWATVAIFADASGWIAGGRAGLTVAQQSIALLAGAALLAAALTFRLRGNVWYAGAVIWGLAGVAVADLDAPARAAGIVAAGLAVALAVITVAARRKPWRRTART